MLVTVQRFNAIQGQICVLTVSGGNEVLVTVSACSAVLGV